MSDQWISVNKEEKAMVGHGVQAIGRSGRNPAHMFTGEGVYTTFSAANVENTFRTLAPALRSPEFVLATNAYSQVLFGCQV
jgi:hypothetical protein